MTVAIVNKYFSTILTSALTALPSRFPDKDILLMTVPFGCTDDPWRARGLSRQDTVFYLFPAKTQAQRAGEATKMAQALGEDGKLRSAPELVVEVLSLGRSDEQRDRQAKRKLYLRRGVQEYWIVDWQNSRLR